MSGPSPIPSKRNVYVRSWKLNEGWGKAYDPATGRKIYLSVGRALISQKTGFLRKVWRTKAEAVAYADRFMVRYQRLAIAKVSWDIWKHTPWHVKLSAKLRQWWAHVCQG